MEEKDKQQKIFTCNDTTCMGGDLKNKRNPENATLRMVLSINGSVMFKKADKLDIQIPKEYGFKALFRGLAIISGAPKTVRIGTSTKTTIFTIEIIRKHNMDNFIEFKEGITPTTCLHLKKFPIKFCRHPDVETTAFMLQGLQKFVDNNLDFYEIIYSGVVPAVQYVTKNKLANRDDLSFAL